MLEDVQPHIGASDGVVHTGDYVCMDRGLCTHSGGARDCQGTKLPQSAHTDLGRPLRLTPPG